MTIFVTVNMGVSIKELHGYYFLSLNKLGESLYRAMTIFVTVNMGVSIKELNVVFGFICTEKE